jgi:photosystem II stability/assembly factor-like uncharacterized protein
MEMARGNKKQVKAEVKIKINRKKGIDPAISKFKKWVVALFGFYLMATCCISVYADNANNGTIWRKSDYGIDEVKVKSVCIIKERPEVVFAGGQRCIYKSDDGGNSWDRVFMLTGERKDINFISYNPNSKDLSIIYAATSDGLYVSLNHGKAWKRVFRGRDDMQRNVRCIAISDDGHTIFIGTERGLFKSIDSGKNWAMQDYFINKSVVSLAIGEGFYYAGANDGVYCQKEGSGYWNRVYNLIQYEEELDDAEYEDNDYEQEEGFLNLNSIAIIKGTVYITTDGGVLFASVGSEDFLRMNTEGLKSKKINLILAGDDMFVASDRGVFKYGKENDIWMDSSIGLTTFNVNMIDGCFERGIIFAATEKGLFRMALDNEASNTGNYWVKDLFLSEPSIEKIQQAAIEYAEVSPEKIIWMRKAAKTQALIPKVTFGIDGDICRKIDLDRGGTGDPDFYIEGPRDKKWGWDIGLTWNLGEYIWNYHQTSIDVRSRLMVQLRNDILDEVTKLYFERLRLKSELAQSPPKEKKQLVLKELRLAELTANIDSLTGGYLSMSIRKNQAEPEEVRF